MNQERLMKVLLSPHLSEKATIEKGRSGCVFCVASDATKSEVKQAVELLFKMVQVESVNIMNVTTKPRRFGRIQGRTKAWKKAYVRFKSGQTIDFNPA